MMTYNSLEISIILKLLMFELLLFDCFTHQTEQMDKNGTLYMHIELSYIFVLIGMFWYTLYNVVQMMC